MYIDTYLYHEIFVDVDVISVRIFIDDNYEKLNRLVISFILGMEEELDPKFFLLSLHLYKKNVTKASAITEKLFIIFPCPSAGHGNIFRNITTGLKNFWSLQLFRSVVLSRSV